MNGVGVVWAEQSLWLQVTAYRKKVEVILIAEKLFFKQTE